MQQFCMLVITNMTVRSVKIKFDELNLLVNCYWQLRI
jgi:hypothetical protein